MDNLKTSVPICTGFRRLSVGNIGIDPLCLCVTRTMILYVFKGPNHAQSKYTVKEILLESQSVSIRLFYLRLDRSMRRVGENAEPWIPGLWAIFVVYFTLLPINIIVTNSATIFEPAENEQVFRVSNLYHCYTCSARSYSLPLFSVPDLTLLIAQSEVFRSSRCAK